MIDSPGDTVRTGGERRFGWSTLGILLVVGLLLGLTGPAPVLAQDAPAADEADPADEEPEIALPIELGGSDLMTKDGVQLGATYYPGKKDKDTVPIILLHGFGGSRKDYAGLAPYLQKAGHTVLVPDLRGHGISTTRIVNGSVSRLKTSRLTPVLFTGMVSGDMETCKSYLMKRNNEAELNIEKLCVVGAESGAAVAIQWARMDWSWPRLIGRKQGQDAAALVLISPTTAVPGASVTQSLQALSVLQRADAQKDISMLIVAGRGDSKAVGQAKRIHTLVERAQRSGNQTEQRRLFYGTLDTKLQGTGMLQSPALNLDRTIAKFIQLRLVDQQFPWRDRS